VKPSTKQRLGTILKSTGTSILAGGLITTAITLPAWFNVALASVGAVLIITGTIFTSLYNTHQSNEIADVKDQATVNSIKIANVENKTP
jgi:hypothetical protein